jgi:hypothetical protein
MIQADAFTCNSCDYKCSKMSDWNRHISTKKHQKCTKLEQQNNMLTKNISQKQNTSEPVMDDLIKTYLARIIEPKLNQKRQSSEKKERQHICSNCNKIYTVKSSLWYHKKKCTQKQEDVIEAITPLEIKPEANSNIIVELLKQNHELQKQIIEMAKEPKITTITNNNQFNLNMFLNEHCKNAINIMDFVNSLDLTIKDLEETGRLGYVNGISRIFINALKNMDITMRPIHCTDIKRETVYVKDKDTWEKDNDEKEKMKKALEQISHKNLKLLPEWQQQNPDFRQLDTPENQQFMKISLSSLGAEYEEEQTKMEKKILKNVMKEVTIEKMPN